MDWITLFETTERIWNVDVKRQGTQRKCKIFGGPYSKWML